VEKGSLDYSNVLQSHQDTNCYFTEILLENQKCFLMALLWKLPF